MIRPHKYYEYVGIKTLRRMANVGRYNRWIYRKISPYLGQRLLEVGGGIGNMTEMFLDRETIVTLDKLPDAVEILTRLYGGYSQVRVVLGDILDPELVASLCHAQFDSVVCINVMEHIRQDAVALDHMSRLLRDGGRLILFVPAGTFLYGTLDKALGHYHRYDAARLRALVERVNLQVELLEYGNVAGMLGWWLNSRVLKRDLLPEDQLRLFNVLARLFFGVERVVSQFVPIPFGLSLLCVAQKRSG